MLLVGLDSIFVRFMFLSANSFRTWYSAPGMDFAAKIMDVLSCPEYGESFLSSTKNLVELFFVSSISFSSIDWYLIYC